MFPKFSSRIAKNSFLQRVGMRTKSQFDEWNFRVLKSGKLMAFETYNWILCKDIRKHEYNIERGENRLRMEIAKKKVSAQSADEYLRYCTKEFCTHSQNDWQKKVFKKMKNIFPLSLRGLWLRLCLLSFKPLIHCFETAFLKG